MTGWKKDQTSCLQGHASSDVDHNIYYLQLSKLQDERSSMQDQLRDYEDRINAMTSHFKNVKQEFLFTQVQY